VCWRGRVGCLCGGVFARRCFGAKRKGRRLQPPRYAPFPHQIAHRRSTTSAGASRRLWRRPARPRPAPACCAVQRRRWRTPRGGGLCGGLANRFWEGKRGEKEQACL
jgi:hypothetical protein